MLPLVFAFAAVLVVLFGCTECAPADTDFENTIEKGEPNEITFPIMSMDAYGKFLDGKVPYMKGAVEIASEFYGEEYSVEHKLTDLDLKMSTISKNARIIKIVDKYDDSVSVVIEKSYVHARYSSVEDGGLASNPDRVKFLPTGLKIYILDFNILRRQDIVNAMKMKLHEKAEKVIFKLHTFEDEVAIPPEYVSLFEFKYVEEGDEETDCIEVRAPQPSSTQTFDERIEKGEPNEITFPIADMDRYNQLLTGNLPRVTGAIEIVPGVSNKKYSLKGVQKRISEVFSNLRSISEAVRVITIRDRYGDSVSVFKGKNHVHARYTTDAIGGLGSDPNRVKLLSVNFKTYIFEFDHLKVIDVADTLNLKLYETAEKIIFKYHTYDDEDKLASYKNNEFLKNFEFQKINVATMRITDFASYHSIRSKDIKFPGQLIVEPSCLLQPGKKIAEKLVVEVLLSKLSLVASKQKNSKIIQYVDGHGNYYSIQPKLRKVEAYINSPNMFGLLQNHFTYLPMDYEIYILRVNEVTRSDVHFLEQLQDRTIITISYHVPPSQEIMERLRLLKTEKDFRNLNYSQSTN